MEYGYFDDVAREYVITTPKTPRKWINYIGTLAFGGFVDQTGGALLCKGDPALNRITKYIAQMPASDFKGETLYIRIKHNDGYRLFSPFYVPCLVPFEFYECRVGLGYSRIRSQTWGVQVEALILIPPGAHCEVRSITITNRSIQPLKLDAIPVVEYTHFDALKQLTNADWVPQTMQSHAIRQKDDFLILEQYAFMKRGIGENYFTTNHAVSSFESERCVFLGDNEYGTWANPLSLQAESLSCSEALNGDNIAALMHVLGTLKPGETRHLITQLGQAAHLEETLAQIEKYRQPESVEGALEQLNRFWDGYLKKQQVFTADDSFNSMLNIHNPHQCYITKTWSRYLSLYQLGFGGRGIGFRDSSQDVMGVLANVPGEAKALLRSLLQVQKRDGSAMHQFNPLTMIASVGDSAEFEDRPHYYCDDHLWVVLAVCAYLRESGDLAFLDELIPYYEKDRQEKPFESGSVLDHLLRAVNFTHSDVGAHGLPKLGFADWNDTINLPAGAESVLAACLYGMALLELIKLLNTREDVVECTRLLAWYEEMRQRVNTHAWDGEWYCSYFDAAGNPLGSRRNDAGQIFAYGQAMPILAGYAPPERARSALDAVNRLLDTAHGIKLSSPGFNAYDPQKGGITTYPPGAKENGGIFLHVNPWVIIAETMMGNGEAAWQYYMQISPAKKITILDVYQCEPYVYPQNILGNEHPRFGMARNSWLSGTASWMYQAGTQYILGIQPEYHGLRVNPCIPVAWDSFKVQREFRGAVYSITVSNPTHVCCGVKQVSVDGQICPDMIIPIFNMGGDHCVEVILG